MIHLDTAYLIRRLVPGSAQDRSLRRWLRSGESIRLSSIVWAEFVCGPVSTLVVEEAAELLGEPIVFDGSAATLAAALFNGSGRRRGTLIHCMIAASAIRAEATIATTNVADVRRSAAFGLTIASQ